MSATGGTDERELRDALATLVLFSSEQDFDDAYKTLDAALTELLAARAVVAAAEAFYAAHDEAWIPHEHQTRVALFDALDARRAVAGTP